MLGLAATANAPLLGDEFNFACHLPQEESEKVSSYKKPSVPSNVLKKKIVDRFTSCLRRLI